ncbi:glycosyltransferase [Pseudomonas turukhanskensis]|uniref:Glycosyl transferase n=1 Tax=Pseudomonas turukhanskensis TaxID=1806536 RepID=A0A9W6NDE0_9PSED|nr:glycosyl transferase [Pseudomonas turukhanskensis]
MAAAFTSRKTAVTLTPVPNSLLVIGYVWPEPRSSAAGGHMMQVLECFLARGWRITFASPAKEGEHKADLQALGVAEQVIELNNESFDHFVQELNPAVVLFDRFMMEEQFGWRVEQQCPNAVRVLETSDLQSLRDARQQLLKAHLAAGKGDDCRELFAIEPAELFRHMAASDTALREIAALYRCDLNLMISDAEISLLCDHFKLPDALLVHCPLLLDATPREVLPYRERAHFISIGNFRHAPNWDAVLWLKQSIWPLIREQLPQAQLHVYGAYTPPKATALHNAPQGFHVMNWAPDALAVMEGARVCLAPLRFGAGIKGKLADAMLCGTPSVTTPIGAEGMHGQWPWPGEVVGDAAAFAEAAVRLYREENAWQQAHSHNWPLLAARYERHAFGELLMQQIEQCQANLAEHRARNFTGAMLRHHQHKSTKYMAQWIEAKSRRD